MPTLPNLIIAGAPKAGTTSLFSYLAQHPEICASDVKELSYFSPIGNPQLQLGPIADYTKHFDHWSGEKVAMEASPSYAFGGQVVIDAIRSVVPGTRIIISLRDPVQRFWSSYTFQRSRGRLLSVRDCDAFITLCERYRPYPDKSSLPDDARRIALCVGWYSDYVDTWLDAFGGDCRIVFAEELFADTKTVLGDLCAWLDIDSRVVDTFAYDARNRTARARVPTLGLAAYKAKGISDALLRRHPKARQALRNAYFKLNTTEEDERLQPETRRRLERLYAESNARTAAILRDHGYGDRLPSWLTGLERTA